MGKPATQIALAILATAGLSACVSTSENNNQTEVAQTDTNQAVGSSLNIPSNIGFANQNYQLAYKDQQAIGNGTLSLYEYTTGGEGVDNWTSLITITHNSNNATPETVLNSLGQTLENENPVPPYELSYIQEQNLGAAQIIYPPTAQYPQYESNTWLIDFNPECGYYNFQVAMRYPGDANPEQVLAENNAVMEYILSNRPQLTCQ